MEKMLFVTLHHVLNCFLWLVNTLSHFQNVASFFLIFPTPVFNNTMNADKMHYELWLNCFSLILVIPLTIFLICLWRNTFFLIIHIMMTSLSRMVLFMNSQVQLQNCHILLGWKRLWRCSWSSWTTRWTNQRWKGEAQNIFLIVSIVNYISS